VTRLTVRALSLLAALALGLLTVVVTPREAYACSCARPGTETPARAADAIFTGVVVASESVRKPKPGRTDFRFAVSRVYKGTVYADQVVASPQGTDGCGVQFEVGSTWVIFAEETVEGAGDSAVFRLVTRLCSGNHRGSTVPLPWGFGQPPVTGASDREEKAVAADARFTRGLKIAGGVAVGLLVLGAVGLAVLWRPRPG
jgi:hypothetical protein